MLEVTYCLSGAHIHDLSIYGEHVRRIFDLTLSSQILSHFGTFLGMTDDNDVDILTIKLSVLKCLRLLTIGCKLFNGHEIQNRL